MTAAPCLIPGTNRARAGRRFPRHFAAAGAFSAAALGALPPRVAAQSSTPPPVAVLQNSTQVAGGLIFLTPSPLGQLPPGEDTSNGPLIVDSAGRPVWFQPVPAGHVSSDLRVQTYQGNPVLTWAQGLGFQSTQPGTTTGYICDTTYKVIATVQAGNGLNSDLHEFQLTPDGTALVTIYNNVPTDLSPYGGPVNGTVQEGAVQEIDIATGNVVMEWHSLDHVAVTESYGSVPTSAGSKFDYFHINSVGLDTDGNLLISARHTWTVYKVDRHTGAVIWRLGGKKSDFALGPGLPFAWQHNAVAVDSSTIRIFDNESNGVPVLPASRAIWVRHDDIAMTATLVESIQHPAGLSVAAEGDAQALANGDTFVGWGILGRYSEFDSSGTLIYDASLPPSYNCYRSYRFAWVGAPSTSPAAAAQFNADGTTTVHAVWNGATEVATWRVMGGASPDALAALVTAPWNGLDTAISLPGQAAAYVQVVAVNAAGASIGTSASTAVLPTITLQPVSQTVAAASTVVFSTSVAGPGPTYQWSFDGTPLSEGASGGATLAGTAGPTLVISGASAANAGSYACTVAASSGSVVSGAATLAVSDTMDIGRLVNVSCRAAVGTGDNVLIGGFVIGGPQVTGQQNLLVRASGPALAEFGVTGVLADPLMVFSWPDPDILSAGAEGWGGGTLISDTAAAVGAFAWNDPNSLDTAVVQTLGAGDYTAIVAGASGDTGIALEEVYDATPAGTYTPSMPRLINVSARAQVQSGSGVMIAGFVIGGSTSRTVLIRASGPALAPFAVSGTLGDPQLRLLGAGPGTALLASNSGWNGDPRIAAAAAAVGAFAWTDASSHDSAILVTLPPGAYTAEVAGQSGDGGVALVEVYDVQ